MLQLIYYDIFLRPKPQIQKSIVKMSDIQPQVPTQVTSSVKTADSLHHQPANQPIMEEDDQGLEPELILFNQEAACLEAVNNGVNSGMILIFLLLLIIDNAHHPYILKRNSCKIGRAHFWNIPLPHQTSRLPFTANSSLKLHDPLQAKIK